MPTPATELDILGLKAVVASPRMRQLLATVERVARSGASVLIEGESGSGKELIARAIHQWSMRCSKPWVDVSCAALPEHLLESELFGHEKGAFSGADSAKPGLFELAHTGTLFLDEIGELEPRMQVKLLRVLDGTPYYRLGGTRKVSVDVRVLCATNQNLEQAVEKGEFRGDLYHRLSQIKLTVPPLRERPEDVVALAEYFLRLQSPDLCLSEAAYEALRLHRWSGNIRELRNRIIRAAIHADGCREVEPEHLELTGGSSGGRRNGSLNHVGGGDLDAMERHAILQVLSETGGHRQQTADRLGISRRTLSRKLRTYRMNGWMGAEERAFHSQTVRRSWIHG